MYILKVALDMKEGMKNWEGNIFKSCWIFSGFCHMSLLCSLLLLFFCSFFCSALHILLMKQTIKEETWVPADRFVFCFYCFCCNGVVVQDPVLGRYFSWFVAIQYLVFHEIPNFINFTKFSMRNGCWKSLFLYTVF